MKRIKKSILKYTKVEEDKCTTEDGEVTDIVAPISTERCTKLKDATPTQKRKRSQGNSPNCVEGSKPTKYINMSKNTRRQINNNPDSIYTRHRPR